MVKKILIGTLMAFVLQAGVSHAASPTQYVVQPRDTLSLIAAKQRVTLAQLIQANPQVTNTNRIYVGQRLNLPVLPAEKTADAIIAEGMTYWGTPYVYGATRFQNKSFDCSSFVQYLFAKQGISLGWNAREQAVQGEWIPFDQIRKGDLLFFEDTAFPNEVGLSKVRHVGIYMGDGKILHTYQEGIGVTISTFHNDAHEGEYWYQHYLFAKRVIS